LFRTDDNKKILIIPFALNIISLFSRATHTKSRVKFVIVSAAMDTI